MSASSTRKWYCDCVTAARTAPCRCPRAREDSNTYCGRDDVLLVSGRLLRCDRDGENWIVTACTRHALRRLRPQPGSARDPPFRLSAGASPFLFVFDDIAARDGQLHAFQRLLHTPEATAMTQSGPVRTLQLRFQGATQKLCIASGAVAPTRLALHTQPLDAPFGAMSTQCDTVVATNPYFWLLATPNDAPAAIRAEPGPDAWEFELEPPHGPVSIRITRHAPGRAGAVAVAAVRSSKP